MCHIYLCTIFFIVYFILTCRSMIPCDSDRVCNKYETGDEPTVRCAICVSNSTSNNRCFMPFEGIFKLRHKSLCDFLPCKKEDCKIPGLDWMRSRCSDSSKYVRHCYCYKPHFGRLCEHEWPEEVVISAPMAVQWEIKYLFLNAVYIQKKRIVMYLRKKQHYETFIVVIRNKFGFYQTDYHTTFTGETENSIFAIIEGEIRFPFLNVSNTKVNVHRLGNQVLGYVSSVSLQISSTVINKEIFKEEYPVFVEYKDVNLNCVPVISLVNCELDGDVVQPGTTVGYNRYDEIEIDSKVELIYDGKRESESKYSRKCVEDGLHYHWSIWKISRYHREVKSEKYVEKLGTQNSKLTNVFLTPYSLDLGSYKVLLEVKNTQYEMSTSNFAYCYFSVRYLPLEAYIEGGSERNVLKELGIGLSAIRSRDPNQPPDHQDHIKVEWSCSETETFCAAKEMKSSDIHRIPPSKLRYNAEYTFTLKVWTDIYTNSCGLDCNVIKPAFAYCKIKVANKTSTANSGISIKCILNCGEKVLSSRTLFLKVETTAEHSGSSDYTWTYAKGDDIMVSADNIRFEGRPSTMLIVKENVFENGASYKVVAEEKKTGMYAIYSFETEEIDYKGNCSVTPTKGVKGKTYFNLNCSIGYLLTYEFYDKSIDDSDNLVFSGRMLGSSSDGTLKDVLLTRGNVVVYFYNTKGVFMKLKIKVELDDLYVDNKIMKELMVQVTNNVKSKSISNALKYISVIQDVIPPEIDKQEILKQLLDSFIQLPEVKSIYDMKLLTSSLYNVLMTLNKPTQLVLSPYLIMNTIEILTRLSKILMAFVSDSKQSQWMSPFDIRTISEAILTSLYAALMSKDKRFEGINEDEFKLNELSEFRKGSVIAEKTLELIKDTMTLVQSPGQPPSRISAASGKFIVWAMIDDNEYPITSMLNDDRDMPIKLNTPQLRSLKKLANKKGDLTISLASIQDNLFWWCTSDVRSNMISFSLTFKNGSSKLTKKKTLDKPITLKIDMNKNLESKKVFNTVVQLDSNLKRLELDLKMAIHRLDPAPKSIMFVKFIFPPTRDPLRVLIMKNYRPDYALMVKNSKIITEENPTYPVNFYGQEEPMFLFMGVLAGPEVPVGKNVSYTFEVSTRLCQLWAQGQWTSEGCKISPETDGKEVQCQCTHLSIFAAAFPVPPEAIDPFTDAKLFLTVFDNPLVVAFVSAVLFLYLILCIWAWRKDKKDFGLRSAILLDDNFPEDKYPYMIAVYTSPRINAGTTANVGLRLIGSDFCSRPHILRSSNRRVLRKNYDDWFIILSPYPLGDVQAVHLWHDNAGPSPDWFCEKIYVYDLKKNTEVLFVIEQWLALKPNEYPEATVIPATTEDVRSIKRLFLDNFFSNFRDDHSIAGILLRHPRSSVTRLQRISILMCCIMMSMLCSIMFFRSDDDELGIDEYEYSVGTREILIAFQCLVITIAVTSLVLLAFRKSYKRTVIQSKRSTLLLRKAKSSESSSDHSSERILDIGNRKYEKSIFEKFKIFVTRLFKVHPLVPIRFNPTENVVEIRRIRLLIAWLICLLVIIVCSYLVMLYGLKLGSVKSKKWLSTVVLALGTDIFVTGPAKIILAATLLSLVFQKSATKDVHQVSLMDIKFHGPENDDRYFQKLLAKRSHTIYAPLSSSARAYLLKKEIAKSMWLSLIEFLIACLFAIILSAVIFHLWTSLYHNNSHISQLVHQAHHPHLGSISLSNVNSVSTMEKYLEITFVTNFYSMRWYNDKLFDNKHIWSLDFTNRLVGLPLIRQRRVVLEICENLIQKKINCSPDLSTSTEDTNTYDARWIPLRRQVEKADFPWRFTKVDDKFTLTLFRLYGASGRLYDKSGYMIKLEQTKKKTSQILAELRMNSWQDLRTRVFFLELTMYNVNGRLFSEVTLIVEYLVSGIVLYKIHVISVKTGLNFVLLAIVFCVFVAYYLLTGMYQTNRRGFLEYISQFRNILQLLIVVLGLLGIFLCCVNLHKQSSYSESFTKYHMSDHFDFDEFTFYFLQLKITLSLLLFVAIFRIFSLLRAGKSQFIFLYTFTTSISWICWFSTIISTILVLLHKTSVLLNMMFIRTKELLITPKCTRYITPQELENTHVKVFIVVRTLLMCTLIWSFVILFMNYAKFARVYKLKSSDSSSFWTFIKSRNLRRNKARTIHKKDDL